jgi:hypothetical protein
MTARFWIGVASREHVHLGIAGGFSQLCHGKAHPLKRMAIGDWLIYYSPKERLEENTPCQKFTAIGKVIGEDVYPYEMFPGFVPYRRNVDFLKSADAPIRPLLSHLAFIKDKNRWGYAFRFGHVEIQREDFEIISMGMLGRIPATSS